MFATIDNVAFRQFLDTLFVLHLHPRGPSLRASTLYAEIQVISNLRRPSDALQRRTAWNVVHFPNLVFIVSDGQVRDYP
jgi:hypothetical protein